MSKYKIEAETYDGLMNAVEEIKKDEMFPKLMCLECGCNLKLVSGKNYSGTNYHFLRCEECESITPSYASRVELYEHMANRYHRVITGQESTDKLIWIYSTQHAEEKQKEREERKKLIETLEYNIENTMSKADADYNKAYDEYDSILGRVDDMRTELAELRAEDANDN